MQESRNTDGIVYRWDKGQTNSRVVDINPNIPIIKLYARNLNIPIRRQIVKLHYKKLDPTYTVYERYTLKTEQLKLTEWKMNVSYKQCNKTGVNMLISDKITNVNFSKG